MRHVCSSCLWSICVVYLVLIFLLETCSSREGGRGRERERMLCTHESENRHVCCARLDFARRGQAMQERQTDRQTDRRKRELDTTSAGVRHDSVSRFGRGCSSNYQLWLDPLCVHVVAACWPPPVFFSSCRSRWRCSPRSKPGWCCPRSRRTG